MRRILARWWPFACCVLLGALLGGGYTLLTEREYAASGYVVVRAVGEVDPAVAVGFAQSYGRMVKSEAVLDAAREEAGGSVADLRGRVWAATSPDAPVIEITGRAPGAEAAARAANAVARALIGYAAEAEPETAAELTELMPARAPTIPVSPAPLLSLAVGTCAGALLGTVVHLTRGSSPAGEPARTKDPTPDAKPSAPGEPVSASATGGGTAAAEQPVAVGESPRAEFPSAGESAPVSGRSASPGQSASVGASRSAAESAPAEGAVPAVESLPGDGSVPSGRSASPGESPSVGEFRPSEQSASSDESSPVEASVAAGASAVRFVGGPAAAAPAESGWAHPGGRGRTRFGPSGRAPHRR
ncbi:hypothetical protein E1265_15035 [Streptomyces sp. 8K308]|uniref:hypothetical protein n=1 Tax=Streptomyces sp. 8K308 TaxID=2530388 RepID=UPI0010E6A621|nr:hypothetical protein [Streptomyces sp. 8K308]TDC22693.1 hypothetical protein E1265_15035 [Streptomyces sp. 8K308]